MESPTHKIQIVAHRGNNIIAPENTMVAFRQALDLGATAIETDVRVAADGVAFLFHDDDLDRTTERTGDASALTIHELRAIDAGSRTGSEYRGEPIPSLAELAALCRGQARLILDLKVNGAVEAISNALLDADFPHDHVSVCAWNDVQAHEIHTILPDARMVYIDEDPHHHDDENIADDWYEQLVAEGYRGLSLEWSKLSDAAIRGAHRHDLSIVTWTVNTPDAMRAAVESGVDGIITDDPKTLVSVLTELR
jgi:glycerophosphoryl diester phosphodiesterase